MENNQNGIGTPTPAWKTIEPGFWKPENDGDLIEGVLIEKQPENKEKKLSALYSLENKDGHFLVWGSAVLDDRMRYVSIGDLVRITFKGKKDSTTKKGQTIKIFKVEVQKPLNNVDFK
jgi:hypothetical protein